MNLVGYSEQYYTIVNGTISDTVTFGSGGFPDWDNTPLEDQICYFNEKDIAYTWDKSNPFTGDYPPGRLDFVFFTNSVISVDKSFIISTEHMSTSLLSQNNLFLNDTKDASDHFPIIVDFVLPMINHTGIIDKKLEKNIIRITDLLGRDIKENTHTPLFYIYDNGTIEKKIIFE
jgi:hypothetical protein